MCRSGQRRSGAIASPRSNGCSSIRPRQAGPPERGGDVRIVPTPNVIKREGGSRRIDIQAGAKDGLGAVAQDVQRTLETMKFPLGYHAILQGAYVELQSTQENLQAFAILALGAIFVLLHLSFQSWRLATLSFLTLPSALVGGVLAAFATGGIITLGLSWASSRSWDRRAERHHDDQPLPAPRAL